MNLKREAESWPTPNEHDAAGARGPGFELKDRHYKPHDLVKASMEWATARTLTGGGETRARKIANGRLKGGEELQGQAEIWQTPQACSPNSLRGSGQDPEKRKAGGHEVTLQDQVSIWQTPGVDSFRRRSGDRSSEMGLDQQARYFPTSLPAQAIPDGQTSSESVPTSRRLNPRFVEWLMGFPIGWTEL